MKINIPAIGVVTGAIGLIGEMAVFLLDSWLSFSMGDALMKSAIALTFGGLALILIGCAAETWRANR